MNRFRSALRTTRSIARVTFSEILRDKVLYGALVICGLLLILGALVSNLSFIRPDRILLDFGLLALAVSSGFLGILGGSVVLIREFERRTVFIALARPISRMEFLVGKYVGLSAVLLLNSLVVSAGFVLVLYLLAHSDQTVISLTLIQALGLLAIQSLVLAAIAMFFSSFSTASLSIVMALGMYLVGVNSSQIRMLAIKQDPGVFRYSLEALAALVPNFEHFNLGLKVSYGLLVPHQFIFYSVAYALTWIILLLVFAGYFLERKES